MALPRGRHDCLCTEGAVLHIIRAAKYGPSPGGACGRWANPGRCSSFERRSATRHDRPIHVRRQPRPHPARRPECPVRRPRGRHLGGDQGRRRRQRLHSRPRRGRLRGALRRPARRRPRRRRGLGHGRPGAGGAGARHRSGRRGRDPAQHLDLDGLRHLLRRRQAGVRRHRPRHLPDGPGGAGAGARPAHPGGHPGAPVRPPGAHGRDRGPVPAARHPYHRGRGPGAPGAQPGPPDRDHRRRRLLQLLPEQEPRRLGRRRPGADGRRRHRGGGAPARRLRPGGAAPPRRDRLELAPRHPAGGDPAGQAAPPGGVERGGGGGRLPPTASAWRPCR